MRSEIKIGIVEDELLIAEKIARSLRGLDYEVFEPVSNYQEALEMIDQEKPDLLILDINLGGGKDGIELAKTINEKFQLPFIFLTANSDGDTVERAKKVRPGAFLVKPFSKDELFASIEIAFNNYSANRKLESTIEEKKELRQFIFIKESHRYIKIQFNEILYIESRENYVVIHTRDKKSAIIRSTFSDFLSQLPENLFFRTHRSFAVQLSAIENVGPTEVSVTAAKVPVSNSYRSSLFAALGISE